MASLKWDYDMNGMSHSHESTSALLAEEALFATFVSILDCLCAVAIGAAGNSSGIFGCQKHFYRIKQSIDCISGKLFDALGNFFKSGHNNNPPFLQGLSHMK